MLYVTGENDKRWRLITEISIGLINVNQRKHRLYRFMRLFFYVKFT